MQRPTSGGAAPVHSALFTFLSVLEPGVWILLFVSLLVSSLVLWLVVRISPEEKKRKEGTTVETIDGALWHLFSILFRGSDYTPRVSR